jgi:hypothetical protein
MTAAYVMSVCRECNGDGEVLFNNSYNRDPQCVDWAICGACDGEGVVRCPGCPDCDPTFDASSSASKPEDGAQPAALSSIHIDRPVYRRTRHHGEQTASPSGPAGRVEPDESEAA